MSRKKILTTIYMTPKQHIGLRKLSTKMGVPMAVFIRDAIDVFLNSREGELQDEASLPDLDV
jgi:predicted DNA-binding protein